MNVSRTVSSIPGKVTSVRRPSESRIEHCCFAGRPCHLVRGIRDDLFDCGSGLNPGRSDDSGCQMNGRNMKEVRGRGAECSVGRDHNPQSLSLELPLLRSRHREAFSVPSSMERAHKWVLVASPDLRHCDSVRSATPFTKCSGSRLVWQRIQSSGKNPTVGLRELTNPANSRGGRTAHRKGQGALVGVAGNEFRFQCDLFAVAAAIWSPNHSNLPVKLLESRV